MPSNDEPEPTADPQAVWIRTGTNVQPDVLPDVLPGGTGSGVADGTSTEEERPVVRLSVNLAPDVADVLKFWKGRKGISITEAVRRAIAVWNFVENERDKGNRIAILEPGRDGDRVKEMVFLD
jgi:hypothetical protein